MKKLGIFLFVALFSFSLTSGSGIDKNSSEKKGECPYLTALETSQNKSECPYLNAKSVKKEVDKEKKACPYVEKQKIKKIKNEKRTVLEIKIT